MKVTPTQLRKNLYQTLDQVLEDGEPVEITRRGRILRIVCDQPVGRVQRIKPMTSLINGSADSLETVDWSSEWKF